MSNGIPHREDGCPPGALFVVTPFVMFAALIAWMIFDSLTHASTNREHLQVKPHKQHSPRFETATSNH